MYIYITLLQRCVKCTLLQSTNGWTFGDTDHFWVFLDGPAGGALNPGHRIPEKTPGHTSSMGPRKNEQIHPDFLGGGLEGISPMSPESMRCGHVKFDGPIPLGELPPPRAGVLRYRLQWKRIKRVVTLFVILDIHVRYKHVMPMTRHT